MINKYSRKALLLVLLLFTIIFGFSENSWAGSWQSLPQWPHGSIYYNAMVTAPDGSIWAGGNSGKTARWNGSSWEDKGTWPHGTGYDIYSLTVANDGSIWAAGQSGCTARWNGSAWESKGYNATSTTIDSIVARADGTILVTGGTSSSIWNGSSWVNAGSTSKQIGKATLANDGSVWAGDGWYANIYQYTGSWTYIGQSNASNNGTSSICTGTDGSIWIASYSNLIKAAFASYGVWPHNSVGSNIRSMISTPDGHVWQIGDSGYTSSFDGSSFINRGQASGFNGQVQARTIGPNGLIYIGGPSGSFAKWTGTFNLSLSSATQTSATLNFNYDGNSISPAKLQRSTDNINFIDVLDISGTLATNSGLSPGTTYYYRIKWRIPGTLIYVYSSSTSCLTVPPTPGAPTVSATSPTTMSISWPTIASAQTYQVFRNGAQIYDGGGTSFTDSGLSFNTQYTYTIKAWNTSGQSPAGSGTARYTLANSPTAAAYSSFTQSSLTSNIGTNGNPAGTQYQFQLKNSGGTIIQGPTTWGTATSYNFTSLASGTNYSVEAKARNGENIETGWVNLGAVMTIPVAPAVTSSINGLSWSNTSGRGYVTASWSAVTGATGYKWYVFDGNAWRSFALGNVTSLDSRTLKIYPDESTIASWSNNAYSSDPFNHSQGGLDLRDDPRGLYAKTPSTTYDSGATYHMSITAYNASGESAIQQGSSGFWPVLPNRTDTSQPTSSVLQINGDAANTGARSVSLTVTASDPIVANYTGADTTDDYSGIAKIQVSNDNFTSYQDFSWSPTTGNSQSGTMPITWTLIAGDGSKPVYIRPVDNAGNTGPVKSSSIYLINDVNPPSVLITLNGASSNVTTDSRYNLLGITANDNLTPPDQLQYRSKIGSGSFSSWAPYEATISNYDVGTTGGSIGLTVEVKDANGNIGSDTKLIYYNTSDTRPAASSSTPTATVSSWDANLDGQVLTVGGVNMKVVQGDTVSIPISGISNANQLLVSFDGVNWSSPDSIPSGTTSLDKVVTFSGEGTRAVYYKTKNSYGAESQVYVKYFLVDKTPPEIIEVKTASGARATSGNSIQLVISWRDNISRQAGYRINGSAWATLPSDGVVTANLPSNGINVLKVEVIDQAGNVESRVVPVRKIAALDTYAFEKQKAA